MGFLFGRRQAAKLKVRRSAILDSDPRVLVAQVVDAVNERLDAGAKLDELPRAAVQAYFVDYFIAQHANGGLSQFVYNSGWEAKLVQAVREGLKAMGARRHLAILERLDAAVLSLGDDLDKFLEGEYFGENDIRDELNRLNDDMDAAGEAEDVPALNRKFVNASGVLEAVDDSVLEARDREARAKHVEAIAHKPVKVAEEMAVHRAARRLCAAAGLEFVSFNGTSFGEHEGEPCILQFVGTNRGTHFVRATPGFARFCEYGTNKVLAEEPYGEGA